MHEIRAFLSRKSLPENLLLWLVKQKKIEASDKSICVVVGRIDSTKNICIVCLIYATLLYINYNKD